MANPENFGSGFGRVTPEQLWYIEVNSGVLKTSEIAKRLHLTHQEVQRAYQYLAISPLTNDGRFTARALGIETGIPGRTISTWAREGKIPSVKTDFHRIEWDGESPIEPEWSGKGRTLYTDDLEINQGRRDTCASCGISLDRKVDRSRQGFYWCSRFCRWEYNEMRIWEKINGQMSPTREFPSYLRLGFQQFLLDNDVMQRKTGQSLFLPTKEEIAPDDTTKEAQIRRLLISDQFRGFVVPQDFLFKQVWGDDVSINLVNLKSRVHSLRKKLVDEKDIYNATGMGYGAGVENLSLSLLEMKFLRLIWQKINHNVASSTVSFDIFGEVTKERLIEIRSHLVTAVREVFEGGQYELVTTVKNDGTSNARTFYRLQKRNQV